MRTEGSEQSSELDLKQFNLKAEEKIEHIEVPSYLKFHRTTDEDSGRNYSGHNAKGAGIFD